MGAVKSIFGGAPKPQPIVINTPAPAPAPAPAPSNPNAQPQVVAVAQDAKVTPTIDDARKSKEEQLRVAKRKGRLANLLTDSKDNTQADLSAPTTDSTLKKLLGS